MGVHSLCQDTTGSQTRDEISLGYLPIRRHRIDPIRDTRDMFNYYWKIGYALQDALKFFCQSVRLVTLNKHSSKTSSNFTVLLQHWVVYSLQEHNQDRHGGFWHKQ